MATRGPEPWRCLLWVVILCHRLSPPCAVDVKTARDLPKVSGEQSSLWWAGPSSRPSRDSRDLDGPVRLGPATAIIPTSMITGRERPPMGRRGRRNSVGLVSLPVWTPDRMHCRSGSSRYRGRTYSGRAAGTGRLPSPVRGHRPRIPSRSYAATRSRHRASWAGCAGRPPDGPRPAAALGERLSLTQTLRLTWLNMPPRSE